MVEEYPHLDFSNLIYSSEKALEFFDAFESGTAAERLRRETTVTKIMSRGLIVRTETED